MMLFAEASTFCIQLESLNLARLPDEIGGEGFSERLKEQLSSKLEGQEPLSVTCMPW